MENRLQLLVDDGGAIEMLKIENTYVEVYLFLLHVVSKAEVMLVLGDAGGVQDDIGEHDGVEPHGVEIVVVEGDVKDGVDSHNEEEEGCAGVEPKGDVEDGGGADFGEHHGVEGVVEDDDEEEEGRAGVEPESVEGHVEDDGGEDISEHHGVEGVVEGDDDEEEGCAGLEPEGFDGHVEDDGGEVEKYDEEKEGHGGQGIGAAIHEDMECDHDGGDDYTIKANKEMTKDSNYHSHYEKSSQLSSEDPTRRRNGQILEYQMFFLLVFLRMKQVVNKLGSL